MLNVECVFKMLTTNRFKRLNTDRLHFRAQQSLCKGNKTFSVRANETVVLDPLFDRKPVKIDQNSSDVVVFRSTSTRTLCLSKAATREKHWGRVSLT